MRPNGRPTARAAVSSGNTDQEGVPAAVDVDREPPLAPLSVACQCRVGNWWFNGDLGICETQMTISGAS